MTDLNNTNQFDNGHAKGHSDDIMSSFLTEDEIRSWKQDLQKLDSDMWKKETDFATDLLTTEERCALHVAPTVQSAVSRTSARPARRHDRRWADAG